MIPKKFHDVWYETEAQAKRRRVNAWPMLICRVGEADHPSLTRVQAFFNRRGFNASVQDFRRSADVGQAAYKFVFFVARTKEEALRAVRPVKKELSFTNSVIFTDDEIEDFVDWAERLKARSHVVGAIVFYKIAAQESQQDIFFSTRSSWFQKEARRQSAHYRTLAKSTERKAEPSQEMLAEYVQRGCGARS